jgi:hypothetical protein
MTLHDLVTPITAPDAAHLDDAHHGDIKGAFGTVRVDDLGPRVHRRHRLMTLLAIVGQGLIVMVPGEMRQRPVSPIQQTLRKTAENPDGSMSRFKGT